MVGVSGGCGTGRAVMTRDKTEYGTEYSTECEGER